MIAKKYLSGEALYGDDFTEHEIHQWFEKEKEGYSDLQKDNNSEYIYGYHQLNKQLGFSHLPGGKQFTKALSFGGYNGSEVLPIQDSIESLTIVDPFPDVSSDLTISSIKKIPPQENGVINLDDNSFDLITCFGVLHHVPNVTFVIKELYRILDKGGYALIREPIISMGDWTEKRPGLTACERGIPRKILTDAFVDTGFSVVKQTPCNFPPITRVFGNPEQPARKGSAYNKSFATKLDILISSVLKWNYQYHTEWGGLINTIKKFRPICDFYVLRK